MKKAQVYQSLFQPEIVLFLLVLVLMCLPLVTYKGDALLPVDRNAADLIFSSPGQYHGLHAVRLWLIFTGLSGLSGLIVFICNPPRKMEFGFLISVAGMISLLLQQVNVLKQVTFTFSWAYWLSLVAFALSGSRCYLQRRLDNGLKPAGSLHIHIITSASEIPENEPSPKSKNK